VYLIALPLLCIASWWGNDRVSRLWAVPDCDLDEMLKHSEKRVRGIAAKAVSRLSADGMVRRALLDRPTNHQHTLLPAPRHSGVHRRPRRAAPEGGAHGRAAGDRRANR